MTEAYTESHVAVARVDGIGFVAVQPPLTADEIDLMEWTGTIRPGDVTPIDESDPAYSLVAVGSRPDSSPEEKTENALLKASRVTRVLRRIRQETIVTFMREPIDVPDLHSNPFALHTVRSA